MKKLSIIAIFCSVFLVSFNAQAATWGFVKCQTDCSAKKCGSDTAFGQECVKNCDSSRVKNCKAALDSTIAAKMGTAITTKPTLPVAPTNSNVAKEPAVVKILSIDGGGVRGVIPAVLVAKIEEQMGEPITDIFDLFVGTSTGGLITLFVNIQENGRQKYSGKEVIQMYSDLSNQIFKNPVLRQVRTLKGIIGSKYSAKPLDDLLNKYFDNLKLSDMRKPVVVTSFDFKRNEAFLFSTKMAKEWPAMFNLYVKDAARATSAAPTYFKPLDLKLSSGADLTLVDGGITANNPGLIGLMEAKKLWPNASRYVIVSLSTGKSVEVPKVKSNGIFAGGVVHVLQPTINGMFEGQSQISNDVLKTLMKSGDEKSFFRIDAIVSKDHAGMDIVTKDNIDYLKKVGEDLAKSSGFFEVITVLKNLKK